jgi:hypothetical protein
MTDQAEANSETGGWSEKKEAMKRLAEALEKTSPPLMNENTANSLSSNQPNGSAMLRKLKKWIEKFIKLYQTVFFINN